MYKGTVNIGRRWRKSVPQAGGVYAIYDHEELIYVGKTNNLKRRLGANPYTKQATSIRWRIHEQASRRTDVEAYFIIRLHPKLNKGLIECSGLSTFWKKVGHGLNDVNSSYAHRGKKRSEAIYCKLRTR